LLSLRLYLDDSIFAWRLHDILERDGNDVTTPLDAGLLGADDETHFAYARQHGLITMTSNPKDFAPLHLQHTVHPGIFAIYQDSDPRDMSYGEMAQAIRNIVAANVPIAGQFHVLNMWRY
jgi:predicted nuclease of predicted toxin-antitoxin system